MGSDSKDLRRTMRWNVAPRGDFTNENNMCGARSTPPFVDRAIHLIVMFALNEMSNPYDAKEPGAYPQRHRNTCRECICATVGLLLASVLLLRFAGSRWGEWPWYFSPREAGFDRIELLVFLLFPLGITTVISIFAGRARLWILGLLALALLLSLV